MKVFVAGGTGVLGRASIPALIRAGHTVRSTARGLVKAEIVRRLGAEPVEVDLFDEGEVRHAIAGFDVVMRLTTKIGSMTKMRDLRTWAETMRLRTEGARILVNAALAEGVPTYVHESVAYVYADGGSNWLTEESKTDDGGLSLMQATLQGEREAERITDAGGRGIVLRFGGFYGPEAASTRETIELIRKRMLPRIGPARNYFSSIYLSDAGRAVGTTPDIPAGIYNVVDDEPVAFAEYLQMVASATGGPSPLHLPGFLGKVLLGDVWSYMSRSQRVSNAKLKQASGWEPCVQSVRDGWRMIAAELGHRKGSLPVAA